jgi:hypothetical protein
MQTSVILQGASHRFHSAQSNRLINSCSPWYVGCTKKRHIEDKTAMIAASMAGFAPLSDEEKAVEHRCSMPRVLLLFPTV